MKISRRGSSANYGVNAVDAARLSFSWNKKEKIIEAKQKNIKDFTSMSSHDYTLQISMAELCEMIKVIGGEPVNQCGEEIGDVFVCCLRELIRIKNCCIGMPH